MIHNILIQSKFLFLIIQDYIYLRQLHKFFYFVSINSISLKASRITAKTQRLFIMLHYNKRATEVNHEAHFLQMRFTVQSKSFGYNIKKQQPLYPVWIALLIFVSINVAIGENFVFVLILSC